MLGLPPISTRTETLCPYTTLVRSQIGEGRRDDGGIGAEAPGKGRAEEGVHTGYECTEGEAPKKQGADQPVETLAVIPADRLVDLPHQALARSEEHTSELQSLMRISYAVFCLKKQKDCTITHQ